VGRNPRSEIKRFIGIFRVGFMILVFGKSGQVATELKAVLPGATFLGREEADLTDPEACAAVIHAVLPSAVINAAAYTAVDKAEEDEATALLVNGAAPTAMARACAELKIPFVHISSDYVFDGGGEVPWTEDSATAPLGAYGRTKLAGEEGVRASGAMYAILRTSWVFSAKGVNFVKTMLRLSETHNTVSVVADQVGAPTPARAIAEGCVKIAKELQVASSLSGTYHLVGVPPVSWAEFAREIFEQARRDVVVKEIPTSAYPTLAKRPLNSRMSCSRLGAFGLLQPDWRESLTTVLIELGVI
jgi:dTDP-4-dehydrorhamnose reductase